jgi:hypothetical protein
MMLFSVNCGHFEPDFYVGDYQNSQLINSSGVTVPCNDPKFNEFGCLSKEQLIELKNLLDRCDVSVKKKAKIEKVVDEKLNQFKGK